VNIGVIVGLPTTTTVGQIERVLDDLKTRFPGVTFAVVTGAMSIWFPLPAEETSS
jgi:hypothetical protein